MSLIWKKIRVLKEVHILCLLYNYRNVTKMEFFGELQASLMRFAQGSDRRDSGNVSRSASAGNLLHL